MDIGNEPDDETKKLEDKPKNNAAGDDKKSSRL